MMKLALSSWNLFKAEIIIKTIMYYNKYVLQKIFTYLKYLQT